MSVPTSIPVMAAVSNPCPIHSTNDASAINLHCSTPIAEEQAYDASPKHHTDSSPETLKTTQGKHPSFTKQQHPLGMDHETAGCWNIPKLLFPPLSRLKEIDPNGDTIQVTDLMSLKGNERVIFPTCLYASCEREIESELIRDLKAACWEQGAFDLSTQERTGQTARRSLTLRLRMRCANHTAKRGCCPFQFTVFWHVQMKYWYYTPPSQAHLKLRHASTCLPLGASLFPPAPVPLRADQPLASLVSPPAVVLQTSKYNGNVMKKGAIPTSRKGLPAMLPSSSSNDSATLDFCLEIKSQQPSPIHKNLTSSSPSGPITLEACLATRHLVQPSLITFQKLQTISSSSNLGVTLESSQVTDAPQKHPQVIPTSTGHRQMLSSTHRMKFPPPSSRRSCVMAFPKPKETSFADSRITLASVYSCNKEHPQKRIFSDDLSVFIHKERQGSSVAAGDSSVSNRELNMSMQEAEQSVFTGFLQEDILSRSTSMSSLSGQLSITSWGDEPSPLADEVSVTSPSLAPGSTSLLWDDLDFAAPQA